MLREVKSLPKDVDQVVLAHAVIPTFDVLVEYGEEGVVFVKRKMAPYKDVWALPGRRMLKTEEVNDTLERIVYCEIGIKVNFEDKIFLGQYVGKFKTEEARQDLSTGYWIKVESNQELKPNQERFSAIQITKTLPQP